MSLKTIGELYPELPLQKIELSKQEIGNMEEFYLRNERLFMDYAMQDSKIVLWHSLQVLCSQYELTGKYTIPITLSSLASSFLKKRLLTEGDYHPSTKNGLISMKNLAKVNTPTGIELSGELHEYIDYFLGSYRGGRNESYLYGIVKGVFYDYDLPGAYPTAMALLDYPDWERRESIRTVPGEVFYNSHGEKRIIKSFTALKIKFKFPETVKYPNLPVRLDFSTIVFPLQGETFCTGHEFILAMKLKCAIEILGGVFIPFVSKTEKPKQEKNRSETIKVKDKIFTEIEAEYQETLRKKLKDSFGVIEEPVEESKNYHYLKTQQDLKNPLDTAEIDTESSFYQIVKELLTERLKYPKGSYKNLLYKFLANAGIGQMARGLNQKVKFDCRTNSTKILPSGDLVSPLFGG